MKIKPLSDKILIKSFDSINKTSGGIIIPDTVKEKSQEGQIASLNDENKLKLKIGDKVIFGKWTGTEIKLGEYNFIIMKESDILAIIND